MTETDVRAAAKVKTTPLQPPSAPSGTKAGESARIQLSGMRKIIARTVGREPRPVPHFYLTIDIDAGPFMEARERIEIRRGRARILRKSRLTILF